MSAIWRFCIVVGLLMLEGGERGGEDIYILGRCLGMRKGEWESGRCVRRGLERMDGLDGTFSGPGWELRRID
jgi:hypothetical protein